MQVYYYDMMIKINVTLMWEAGKTDHVLQVSFICN